LGYAAEDLHGTPFQSYIHTEDRFTTHEILTKISKPESPQYFESRFRTADGSYRWLGCTVAPFAEQGLLYIFARDLTGRREREDKIRSLNDDLKKQTEDLQLLNKEQEAFSYSIAHDLRSPLIAITGYSEMLLSGENGEIPPNATQAIRAITRNCGRMSRLIEDFLKFFRIDRQEARFVHVDMEALVHEAVVATRPPHDSRTIEFKIGALPSAKGDPAMLSQVFVNLISNAVKFTSKSAKAEIEIGCSEDEGENIYFVKDNGVGFSMEYYKQLFGVFQRLHSRDEFDGTGIGLAVVNKVIQRHGGQVWAEGKVNQGAIFYFTLG
ncbi:MAG TPA: ATP-binding protein, partial [Opitutaceae bacterium]|nr:ATP-binding protein [Opitutaceae bacterium]